MQKVWDLCSSLSSSSTFCSPTSNSWHSVVRLCATVCMCASHSFILTLLCDAVDKLYHQRQITWFVQSFLYQNDNVHTRLCNLRYHLNGIALESVKWGNCFKHLILLLLEDTARYAGLLLAPAEGFGLQPRLFLHFGQKLDGVGPVDNRPSTD